MTKPCIEFFFDIGSPYSYLAATVINDVGERTGTPVRWCPFLLGGVFKASGNTMPGAVQSKGRWMLADLERWAVHYGVPFQMSRHFPLNTLRTQRALVATKLLLGEEAVAPFAQALFEAYWVQDQDVSKESVIGGIAEGIGYDGSAILTGTFEQRTKDALREMTDNAVGRGAFGAPTFFVGEAMFWGNDRLMLLEAMLSR
jgi:2-hydroxychromene-2-carboxylate isomerase